MKIAALLLAQAVPVPFSAMAEMSEDVFTPGKVSAELGLGSLSGQTRERVYDPYSGGKKISQLNWKYGHAAIVKGSLDWDVLPRFTIGASGWTTIAGRGSYMDDTDWQDENRSGWTDQSRHPATRLNYASEFDVSVKGWLLNKPAYRAGVMAGYQENRYSFNASGGTYHYTDEETGERYSGTFPSGETVIGYKQHFKMPYIGLAGVYRYDRFEFGGSVKYSGWVRTSDNDEHYLTDTTFRDDIRNQRFYSLAGSAGYYLTPEAKIYVEGAWSRVTNKKGSVSVDDYGTSEKYSAENASGIESYSFMATAGLRYHF